MTETVVHVTTLDQWKSVLDVWFEQGYEWGGGTKKYYEEWFDFGDRFIGLFKNLVILVTDDSAGYIEYADFMAQQEKTMAKETYYITRKQFDLIEKLKSFQNPLFEISHSTEYVNISTGFDSNGEQSLLRYLGGDTSIEFKVQEQLYRLWRIDDVGERVYMKLGIAGTPTYTPHENSAFTATREEIEKNKTVSWDIEKAD